MVSQWRTLGWGAGEGLRLWSPGQALALRTEGTRLAWWTHDGLFVLDGDQVHFLAMPVPVAMSVSPTVWSVVLPGADGQTLCWGRPGSDWRSRLLPPGRVACGGAWVRWRRGTQFHITTLSGRPISAPMGACSALPWPDGPGASWWEDRYLYRLSASGGVSLAGILPGPITAGVIGPGGAAVLAVGEDLYGLTPGGLPALLTAEAGLDEARLSRDAVLLPIHDGVGLFSLRDGSLIDTMDGDGVPVGVGVQPCVLDEDAGILRTMSGDPLVAHFCAGAPLQDGEMLYGPGGGAWDLHQGRCRYRSTALNAEQILPLGNGVLCVHARTLVHLDGAGVEQRRLVRPSPGAVRIEGERLLFVERRRTLITDLNGKQLETAPPQAAPPVPPMTPPADCQTGLKIDGSVRTGGRLWQWNASGLLVSSRDA